MFVAAVLRSRSRPTTFQRREPLLITDDTILGYRVPVVLRSILRALGDGPEIRNIPYGPPPDPADATTPEDRDFVTILGGLLRDHGTRVAIDNLSPPARVRLDELRAAEILDLTNGAYRASTSRCSAATCCPLCRRVLVPRRRTTCPRTSRASTTRSSPTRSTCSASRSWMDA